MIIEITSATIAQHGVVNITALDVSEENLQRMMRNRDDGFERELEYQIDTKDAKAFQYLYRWLKRQKATKASTTFGEALQAVVGTHTQISGKYRVWDI